MTIWISDKLDIKTINITKAKEGHLIMIKESIHQEDINVYTPKNT